MLSQLKTATAVAITILICGCQASSTEENFGSSVRNMIAQQQIESTGPLQPNEPLASGDGRRLESVTTVYQSMVGDPGPVVRQIKVEGEGGN